MVLQGLTRNVTGRVMEVGKCQFFFAPDIQRLIHCFCVLCICFQQQEIGEE